MYPDPSKPYTLYTDASKYAWAGVLTQEHDGVNKPVSYVSGLFRGSQINWAALTKEAYAIYMSCKKLDYYTNSTDILLLCDHLPLKKFLEKTMMNATVNNWAVELGTQKITFKHIAGKDNILADTLSHLIKKNPDIQNKEEEEGHEFGKIPFQQLPPAKTEVTVEVIEGVKSNIKIDHTNNFRDNKTYCDSDFRFPLKAKKLAELQQKDPACKHLLSQDLDSSV